MLRSVGIAAVSGLAVTAGLAFAADGPPKAHSAALRLPEPSGCVQRSVRATFVPPDGTTFSSLVVLLGDDEVLQLAGLDGPGSVKITLPFGRSRVRLTATTDDGRFLRSSHRYRRCVPKPGKPQPSSTATPAPTSVTGGGDQ